MNLNWDKYGIDPHKVRGGKSLCPQCSHTRKDKRDKCLSVDLEEGLFNCHNCGFKGTAMVYERQKKEYEKPVARLEKVSKKVIEFFEKERKISNNTLLRFGITEATEWMPQFEKEVPCICFNYFRDEQLVNIKFRGPKKSFKMVSKAELIFYNLDAIKGQKECIICEGEIDCMSFHEAGFFNVVSVPNGASKGSQKLEYLDNCWEYFEGMEKIILAVDNDEAGNSLREELARRLGKEKCYRVTYLEGCKDINDVLQGFGITGVQKVAGSASEWPLEGIRNMEDMIPVLDEWFYDGYPEGDKAGINGFDEYLSFVPGQLTIITGIPGHGKDEFANLLMSKLAVNKKWKFGVFGFEETPEETTSKLAEKIIGKSFGFRKDPSHRLTELQYQEALGIIDHYFFIVSHDEIETGIENILNIGVQLVKRKGIKGLYINPWNWIDHQRPERITETEYISQILTKIIKFARKYSVHVFLLAHTTKMQKDNRTKKYEIPTLYNISGSANFYNKTHNGITIYRDFETGIVDVYVQKVKQSWLGKIGYASFRYDTMTRQYVSTDTIVSEIPQNIGQGKWKPVEQDEDYTPF